MLKLYRDIIVDNRMDFSDIIRFFNGLFWDFQGEILSIFF